MRKIVVVVLLSCLCLLSACRNKSEGQIVIAGSTSVQPFAEILAEEYADINPLVVINVQGGGSSAGITAVFNKTADIGMSSRKLKDNENLWSVEIAKDGLVIIVNPDNPVEELSLAQVRAIYAHQITNWKEVGGKDTKIHIITREEGSGTRSAFEELVMEGLEIAPKAIVQDSNGTVRQLVGDDRNAIGFISLGLVNDKVKPVKLEGVVASRENVINHTYLLFRPFLFTCLEEPEGAVKEFIDFVTSPHGQEILTKEGLIPE